MDTDAPRVDLRERLRAEWLATPVEERLALAKSLLPRRKAKVDTLQAEIDSGCSGAWFARRQMPYAKKCVQHFLNQIAICEDEIENAHELS
jgi:hypothetical protein